MQKFLFSAIIAMEAIVANLLRSFLTALGIIFGVAAVIAMLAIGTGAKQELLNQMKLVGSNNIVIKSVIPNPDDEEESAEEGQENKRPYSPGLTLMDAENMASTMSSVELISPEIVLSTSLVRAAKLKKVRTVGVTNAFFEINNLEIEKGKPFDRVHLENGSPVCIIGKEIQNQFFSGENPLGKKLKCGNTWLTVIGVIRKRSASKQSLSALGIRDYNGDVYVPVQTALLRFKNRALLTSKALNNGGGGGFVIINDDENSNANSAPANYHQLDKLVVRVSDAEQLESTTDVIARMLKRRHWEVIDYEVSVPELELKQQQKTKDLFNLVLGAIAGISLLVGGIGIMNIMLASVLERIKEIGLRRSLGAREIDIIYQFVMEAVTISLFGGLIGVGLGVIMARIAASIADIPTVVTFWSIALSFGVAAATGLFFGIIPARRAARLDPITALRND
ncbi:MAG: ABC transporter permease [Bacteroidota bacterium]